MMRLFFFSICLWTILFFPLPSAAAETESSAPIKTAELEQIFQQLGYQGERGYLMLPTYRYPALYLNSFPSDFSDLTDENRRQSLFIKILAPLALRLNQELEGERARLEELYKLFQQKQQLSAEEKAEIEKLASRYDVFTRLQGLPRYNLFFKELLRRVDTLPPSFMIATAALETNWGTSRLLREGNALYRKLSWHTDEGLKPVGETTDDSYRIKTYPNLYAAMQEFALRLNSNIAFTAMWDFRRELRLRGSLRQGTSFAYTLTLNSYLKNYAGILEYTIAFYELNIIDKSALDSKITAEKVPERQQHYFSPNP